ncbi:MAG: hypothetical protein FJX57_11690 [Alphaproteobacteria bacterium]|nr:hypothetical protein [Alphaproteobacteria bacterium]
MRRLPLLVALFALALTPLLGAAQPAQQQLRVGVWDLPPSRGNPFGGRALPSTFLWDAIFDPLVRIDETGASAPALALEWSLVEPTRWRFKLRPGVSFHNGAAFDADAVVATIAWLASPAGRASPVGTETREIAAAERVDALTVDILTAQPDAILPNRLAMVAIVEPRAWAQGGPEGFAREPIGTGAFRLEAWTPGAAQLAAAPQSWRKPATLQKLRLVELPERPARLQALLSGQIDVAFGLSPDQIPELRAARQQVMATPAPQVMSLAFVTEGRDSPLRDRRVRLAMNHAVNRPAIAEALLAGLGRAASHGATATAFGYDPALKPIPYDPARAKALLAEAGHPRGFAMVAEVVVDAFPGDGDIYQQMAADLDAVGIKVELRQLRFPEWLRRFLNVTWEGQAFGLSWNTAPFMDSLRPYLSFSCLKRPAHWCDPEVMPLIEAAGREFDPVKRLALLHRLHAATQANPPALFLVEQVDVTGLAPRVEGFRFVNRTANYESARFR